MHAHMIYDIFYLLKFIFLSLSIEKVKKRMNSAAKSTPNTQAGSLNTTSHLKELGLLGQGVWRGASLIAQLVKNPPAVQET